MCLWRRGGGGGGGVLHPFKDRPRLDRGVSQRPKSIQNLSFFTNVSGRLPQRCHPCHLDGCSQAASAPRVTAVRHARLYRACPHLCLYQACPHLNAPSAPPAPQFNFNLWTLQRQEPGNRRWKQSQPRLSFAWTRSEQHQKRMVCGVYGGVVCGMICVRVRRGSGRSSLQSS